jgi:hypothetical protein
MDEFSWVDCAIRRHNGLEPEEQVTAGQKNTTEKIKKAGE